MSQAVVSTIADPVSDEIAGAASPPTPLAASGPAAMPAPPRCSDEESELGAITTNSHRYRLTQKLRSEWAGNLYEAIDEEDPAGVPYALRLLPGWLTPQVISAEGLSNHVAGQNSLTSRHLLRPHDAGFDGDSGRAFLVSEWCPGETLEEILRQRDFIPASEAATLLQQLCSGLGEAHAQGLWHGALKPSNIVLAPPTDGEAPLLKLTGLGLLPLLLSLQPSEHAEPLGTPLWMAPEQTSTGRPCGVSTDLWALGLLTFRMLTGQHYFRAANRRPLRLMPLLREITVEALPPASARARELGCASRLPPGFDRFFARCVARAPESRFLDAKQAYAALAPLLNSAPDSRGKVPAAAPASRSGVAAVEGRGRGRAPTSPAWRYALGLALLLPVLQAGLHARGVPPPASVPAATPVGLPAGPGIPPATAPRSAPLSQPTAPRPDVAPATPATAPAAPTGPAASAPSAAPEQCAKERRTPPAAPPAPVRRPPRLHPPPPAAPLRPRPHPPFPAGPPPDYKEI